MLTIARTLMGNPRCVLLDEPSEGLAPVIVEQMARRDPRAEGARACRCCCREQNLHFAPRSSPTAPTSSRRARSASRGTMAELAADADAARPSTLGVIMTPRASHRAASTSAAPSPTSPRRRGDRRGALAKVPTTVDNQAFGVLAALAAAGRRAARSSQAIVHGTTTTTNALLERKIATVGLITTRASATCSSSAGARGRALRPERHASSR